MDFTAFDLVKFVYMWLLVSAALLVGKRWIFPSTTDNQGKSVFSRVRVFVVIFVVIMFASLTGDLIVTAILGSTNT